MKSVIVDATTTELPDMSSFWLSGTPTRLLRDLTEYLIAAGGNDGGPFVVDAEAEPKFRKVAEVFGFERLPATYHEALGMLSYCQMLDTVLTLGDMSPEDLTGWRNSMLNMLKNGRPELVPAIQLAIQKDIPGLRKLHKVEDTLARLGKTYFLT